VPGSELENVTENGLPIQSAAGVTFLRTEDAFVVLALQSGCYEFGSRLV